MNTANAPPNIGRLFYVIQEREDDDSLVDVYLMPFIGVKLVVRGVVLQGSHDTHEQKLAAVSRLDEDIRARYYAWCESAEVTDMRGGRI